MGTDKRLIIIDDEDVLNLNNAWNRIIDMQKFDRNYEPLEVLTIRSIVKRYDENSIDLNKLL